MVWNCPHCRAALALSDDLLGSSWNVSQCPNCDLSGFIRKPGNTVIKVDQVPAGEKILIAKSIAKPQPLKPIATPLPKRALPQASLQPRSLPSLAGKAPWPTTVLKPVIRPAMLRSSISKSIEIPQVGAQLAGAAQVAQATAAKPALKPAQLDPQSLPRPALKASSNQMNPARSALADKTQILPVENPTTLVDLKHVDDIKQYLSNPPEFTREVSRELFSRSVSEATLYAEASFEDVEDSDLIERPAAPTRTFEIPQMPKFSAVGHSVKHSSKNPKPAAPLPVYEVPEALPELPAAPPTTGFFSELSAVAPMITFLIVSGIIGWNAIRYVQGTTETAKHDIVDRVSQRSMAPVRTSTQPEKKTSYADDPTQLRTRSTEVQAYSGPGAEYKTSGILKPGRLYSVLEKNGNWIKFALDQTHAAWVSIAGVDLIR